MTGSKNIWLKYNLGAKFNKMEDCPTDELPSRLEEVCKILYDNWDDLPDNFKGIAQMYLCNAIETQPVITQIAVDFLDYVEDLT